MAGFPLVGTILELGWFVLLWRLQCLDGQSRGIVGLGSGDGGRIMVSEWKAMGNVYVDRDRLEERERNKHTLNISSTVSGLRIWAPVMGDLPLFSKTDRT